MTGCTRLSRVDRAWLAGLIDGEGCLHARLNRRVTIAQVLRVAMTHRRTVRRLRELTGHGRVYRRPPRTTRHKPSWVWVVSGREAIDVVERILPFMVTKQEEAILFLRIGLLPRTSGRERVTSDILAERTYLVNKLKKEKQHNG